MSDIEKSWHRQEDENDRAYRAFTLYLNQPLPRRLQFVTNTGYSSASVNKWSKNHDWVKRSMDYDNYRADSIMEKDVSLVNLYQRKVTEAGIEDMQILRKMWMQAAEMIQEETENNGDLTPAQLMSNIQALAKARLDIDKLSRLTTRMPDGHKAMIVPEDADAFPDTVIELSFNGVRSIPDEVEEAIGYDDEEEIIT